MVDHRPQVEHLGVVGSAIPDSLSASKRLNRENRLRSRRRHDFWIALEEAKRFERQPIRRADHDLLRERADDHFEGDSTNPSLTSESKPARISLCADGPRSNAF